MGSRAFLRGVGETPVEGLEAVFRGIEAEIARDLDAAPGRLRFRRGADLRYAGQAFELTVAVGEGVPDLGAIAAAFDGEHERQYGHRGDGMRDGQFVTLRSTGFLLHSGQTRLAGAERVGDAGVTRRAYFGERWHECAVVSRGAIGGVRAGPLIVEEYEGTGIVPPGASVAADGFGNLVIELPA